MIAGIFPAKVIIVAGGKILACENGDTRHECRFPAAGPLQFIGETLNPPFLIQNCFKTGFIGDDDDLFPFRISEIISRRLLAKQEFPFLETY
jgi:hypothetical protein